MRTLVLIFRFMESNLVAYGSKETIEETILKYILIKKWNVLIFGRSNLNTVLLQIFIYLFVCLLYSYPRAGLSWWYQ